MAGIWLIDERIIISREQFEFLKLIYGEKEIETWKNSIKDFKIIE